MYSAEAGPKQAAKPKKEKVTTEAPKPESSADTALIEKTDLEFMDKNNGEITTIQKHLLQIKFHNPPNHSSAQ